VFNVPEDVQTERVREVFLHLQAVIEERDL
jgi:hypothetical protein